MNRAGTYARTQDRGGATEGIEDVGVATCVDEGLDNGVEERTALEKGGLQAFHMDDEDIFETEASLVDVIDLLFESLVREVRLDVGEKFGGGGLSTTVGRPYI